jgi:hypothetical protein
MMTALVTVFLSLKASESKEKQSVNSKFTLIFNGHDLSGWDGQPGSWKVEDGRIVCTGASKGKNWLIWRGEKMGDMEFKLNFRFHKGNSGVQIRSQDLGDWQVRGYQVEVAAHDKMGLWHHSLREADYRSHLAEAGEKAHFSAAGKKTVQRFANAKTLQSLCKDGKFNDMHIIAKGSHLVQKINGVVFAELTDEDRKYSRRSGLIALQDHGRNCKVEFKDIFVRSLD